VRSKQATDTTPKALVEKKSSSISQLTVLVAEDNIVNQLLVKKILESSGYSVVIADNGHAACLSLQELEEVDIILMDIQMPVMGGLEATKMIREREQSSGRHVPIIALTAHAMPGHREEYLSAGMDGYVTKPINRQALLETIQQLTLKR
jgi:CheY-like chemotaxis protein